MKRSNICIVLLFTTLLLLSGCGAGSASNQTDNIKSKQTKIELILSAAASLTGALEEIKVAYEAEHPSIRILFNFGSSGALQQQIQQGAPADLFLSAASKNMQALVNQQLIDANKQTNVLTNELVVVTPTDGQISIEKLDDLTKAEVRIIAIGIPETVPAGSYAKEVLTARKLWDVLQPRMVQGKDVRQVLQYVETGNADAGFVYRTDALTSTKVNIAFAADSSTYTSVEYPFGIVKATKHSTEAEKLYNYLQSKESLKIFVKYGFSTPLSEDG